MLSIATVQLETRNGYVLVKVSLENQGASVVGPGTMLGRQTLAGGAVHAVEFRNSSSIPPGCTAKVSRLLSAMTELQFTGYRQSDGVIIPFSGGLVKRLSFLRSVAVVTAHGWDEARSRSASIVARLRALYATTWTRLEIDRRLNHGAEVAAQAWRSSHADFGRWRDEVLLPRIRTIGARSKALHENTRLRLADAKQKGKHGAEVAGQAWRSGNAGFGRWRDEVLLPRIRSIAARLKALHENAWLRLREAKQNGKHGAEEERQAWEAADAEIMRWRHEVLLPRIRTIAARFKALHENAWLRLAEAKRNVKRGAQDERQAWESADAEILRWWHEVLLPRIRFYRRPN